MTIAPCVVWMASKFPPARHRCTQQTKHTPLYHDISGADCPFLRASLDFVISAHKHNKPRVLFFHRCLSVLFFVQAAKFRSKYRRRRCRCCGDDLSETFTPRSDRAYSHPCSDSSRWYQSIVIFWAVRQSLVIVYHPLPLPPRRHSLVHAWS